MNYDRTSNDDHSIWASRPSLASENTPLQRRARAGTLPSRLPSRLDTSAPPRPDFAGDGLHHGSLALISPDGNDIVYDKPLTNSRFAVGQHISGDERNSGYAMPQLDSSLSSGSAINASPLANNLTPLSAGGTSLGAGRTRSGSMNAMASGSYNPFGQSIWNQPSNITQSSGSMNTHLTVPGMGSSGSGTPPVPSQQHLPGHSPSPASSPSLHSTTSTNGNAADPLLLFNNELNKSAMPSRIRSYTLDTGADWAAPQPPIPSSNFPRGRAQTLLGNTVGSTVPPVSLGRFGKQHQLQHDATALGGVQLGELSHVPTPALWISNVPPQATPYTLHTLFGSFGRIESARVVPNHRCAYVLFSSTVQAIEAQATANGLEIYNGNGPSTVAFAQVAPAASSVTGAINPVGFQAPGSNGNARQGSPLGGVAAVPLRASTSVDSNPEGSQFNFGSSGGNGAHPVVASPAMGASSTNPPLAAGATPGSANYILQVLGADKQEVAAGVSHLSRAANVDFNVPIPSLSELLDKDADRTFNTATLRELRRKLENQTQNLDIVDIALEMQEELPILASDYIGNTVVQHVYEAAPSVVRDMMLRRLKTVFAATGTHKNGTWAVQKMIDLARGPRQYYLCAQAIQNYLVPLLLDQFGNYVVQGCLKFGAPYSDFVYAGIAASLAKIAPNRFGARAIRAVLESKYTSLASQRLVATAIVQQLPVLATNANGCLLVSWLLDHAGIDESVKGTGFENAAQFTESVEKKEKEHSGSPGLSAVDKHELGGSTNGVSSTTAPSSSSSSSSLNSSNETVVLAQQLKTHALVAAQLIPQHLVSLCTSKLGSGIIVKLASSPAHAASQRVFDALFEPLVDTVPSSLKEALNDPSNQGASCILKLLTVFPPNSLEKQVATSKVRAALIESSVKHRRLMEEVGLETPEPETRSE